MKGRRLRPQFNVLTVLERGVSFDKRSFRISNQRWSRTKVTLWKYCAFTTPRTSVLYLKALGCFAYIQTEGVETNMQTKILANSD
jgi:hypothetical protein